MNVLIVEDEEAAANHLAAVLKETDDSITIMAVLQSVKETVTWLRQHQPDVIFMDIHLADDISFSIFEQVDVQAPIIFTTAYDHYAIKAFKLKSIDYLLKPIDKKEVQHALSKYRELASHSQADMKQLLQLLNTIPEYQKRFMISSGTKIRSVESEAVAAFYSEGRYVMMLLNDGSKHITDYTLDKLESILDPAVFFRIHRGMTLRFGAIEQMHTYTKSRIKIEMKPDPGFEVIVSIDRSGAFKKWLNR
jgi:DNA-binding LytR/AlgR family response regulator